MLTRALAISVYKLLAGVPTPLSPFHALAASSSLLYSHAMATLVAAAEATLGITTHAAPQTPSGRN